MSKQRVMLLVAAGAVILISLVLIFRRTARPAPPDLLGFSVVGEVAAEETARLIGGRGRVVVIYFEPAGGAMRRTFESLRGAIESRIGNMAGIQVVARENVTLDSVTDSRKAADLVLKHGGVDAIVLVGGQSSIGSGPFLGFQQSVPGAKLVAVLTFGSEETKRLLEAGILTLAIEYPLHPLPSPTSSRGPRDAFDSVYVVVTATNIHDLRLEPMPTATTDSVP